MKTLTKELVTVWSSRKVMCSSTSSSFKFSVVEIQDGYKRGLLVEYPTVLLLLLISTSTFSEVYSVRFDTI